MTPTSPFAVRVESSANRVIDAISDESTNNFFLNAACRTSSAICLTDIGSIVFAYGFRPPAGEASITSVQLESLPAASRVRKDRYDNYCSLSCKLTY